ncbi:AAA family ATPase [Blastopirellula marina]|uniref:Probable regulatory protein n=1 Tax=Blastopirellula marina DSM 3645 TaxID=314230 RepID=A3ZTP8_9BACT|nr:AAA family ATPase [Blastopirellula marina]EAQ79990.1 probable regulatory protein [Blastopirellula marina DSM 3645]
MSSPTSDTIEFACSACQKSLRVPRSAAGKKAKCPDCGSVQVIPDDSANGAADEPKFPAPEASHVSTPATPPTEVGAFRSTIDGHHAEEGSDTRTRQLFKKITQEISKIYVGQDELVLGTLTALFSSGHVLIESAPGLGKTLFVRTLGRVLGCQFGRVQFTADLMPSDITGAPIFDMKTNEFRFRPGPIFTQLLLADEINRSPAKTHAALLEIMQEFRVTIDGTSHKIERPFLVLATQNPIESEGTYNLPEAQLDRFMFKLNLNYPAIEEEAEILRMHSRQVDINRRLEEELEVVTSPQEILEITQLNSNVIVDDKLIDYINKIVRLTREWPQFHMGASTRAGITLMQGARTLAAFSGRNYAVPDDVVQIAIPTLRHRVILSAEAEVEGHDVDDLLTELIRTVEVPRL